MAAPSAPTPKAQVADAGRRRRQRRVVGGVFLTFAGLLFASLLLPTSPAALAASLPIAALALLVLWGGGLLLGSARGIRDRDG